MLLALLRGWEVLRLVEAGGAIGLAPTLRPGGVGIGAKAATGAGGTPWLGGGGIGVACHTEAACSISLSVAPPLFAGIRFAGIDGGAVSHRVSAMVP